MKNHGIVFHYRCPECHYLVEKEILFDIGCPVCGWISPNATSKGSTAENRSELVDVFDEGDIIWVTAKLPLIDEDNINLDVKDNMLLIYTRNFKRSVFLHYSVKPDIERTYRNGILEIKLKKIGGECYG
jgi:HSP20 family molecular chaperone IbpA